MAPAITGELHAFARLRRRLIGDPRPTTREQDSDPHDDPDPLVAGMLIGAYRLLRPLGQGGMGEVWLAHDPRLDRKVAIKALRPRAASDPARARARLVREAQAIARIGHPNVVAVYDAGMLDVADSRSPRAFIAMEYVEGQSLAQWLSAARPTAAEILEVFVAAGRGLVAAHNAGQVHRDFKPANVMLGTRGEVKVLDFGIALVDGESPSGSGVDTEPSRRVRAASADSGRLTETGFVMGTPRYMSPEQHTGRVATPASDQFSFCCALLEALQGAPAFAGRGTVELGRAKLRGAIADGSTDVPKWLRSVLARGLARAPEERWPSMVVLLEQLSRRRSSRLRAVFAGLAGVGALAVTLASPADDRCQGRPSVSDARQAEILAQQADGDEPATRVVDALRGHDARLTGLEVTTCESHRDGLIGDAAFDRRVECLRGHRRDLEHAAGLLESGAAVGGPAMAVVHGLVDARACVDDERLALAIAPPTDSTTALAIDRARTRLSAARFFRYAGLAHDARAAVEDARVAVTGIDYPPIAAEIDFAAGQVQLAFADPEAVDTLGRALATAESFGDDRLAAEIAASFANAAVRQPAALEGLTAILPRVDAIIRRAGDPPTARGDYWTAVSTFHTKRGEYEKSLAATEQARVVYQTALGPEDRRLDSANFNAGIALINLRRPHEGVARFAQVTAWRERVLGPLHRSTISALAALGVGHVQAGELDQAQARLSEAVERAESAEGPWHAELPFSLAALGDLARRRDRLDYALVYYRRALAIAEHNEGPMAAETATLASDLGDLERQTGHVDDARAHLDQAITAHEHMLGREHALVAQANRRMAELEVQAGRPARARSFAREAIAILEGLAATPEQLAEARRPLDAAMLAMATEHGATDRSADSRADQ